MDDSIHEDLLAAHVDALLSGGRDYHERYSRLFPEEVVSLAPLFEVAELLHALFQETVPLHPDFRSDLKADLLAQAHTERLAQRRDGWRWAAIGASVTVVGVIAAAAWRGNYQRGAT